MRRSSTLTLGPLVAVMYFTVSGGPFRVEGLVGSGGPGGAVLLLVLTPPGFSGPGALLNGGVASLVPAPGGYFGGRWGAGSSDPRRWQRRFGRSRTPGRRFSALSESGSRRASGTTAGGTTPRRSAGRSSTPRRPIPGPWRAPCRS